MILYDLASKMGDFVYFAKKMADFAWFCMILHFSNSVYIMSGQTFTKNAKNGQFLASFWNPEACGQTVLPDGSILMRQKLMENAKIEKFKYDILGYYLTLGSHSIDILSIKIDWKVHFDRTKIDRKCQNSKVKIFSLRCEWLKYFFLIF